MTADAHTSRATPANTSSSQFSDAALAGRPGRLELGENSRITRRITAIAVGVGVLLAIAKLFLWSETGSVGVFASLVHSALDLSGAVGSFIAVRYAAKAPSERYRFGRGKAESFAAVFQVCLIVLAATHLLETALGHLGHSHSLDRTGFAVIGMLVLIGLTLWLVVVQGWAIRATGSLAVRGDRAHYTADVLANSAVVIGLLLSARLPWIDAAIGVGFALWLFWTAWRIANLAWGQLMDRELPDAERDVLKALANADPQVIGIRSLRTRAAGPRVHIEMDLDLDDRLSLADAHSIALGVRARIADVYRAADIGVYTHPVACPEPH